MRDNEVPRSDRFQEGVDARSQGVSRADNPYGLGTVDHKEWDAGWRAIFDLDEDDDPDSTRECSLKADDD